MNSCAVIIVNYNTGKLLSQVIDCVIKAQGVDEIIVVDNNSSDNSMEQLPDNPKIKTILRKTNAGFGSSCNLGAKHAQSEYLLFLNPDCLIQKDSIVESVKTFNKSCKLAIVGALVKNSDGTEQQATRRDLPTLWRAIKTYTKIEKLAKYCGCFAGVNLNYKPMFKQAKQVEAISGAYIFINASIFKELGGFDEGFFMHFEDLDLCKRTSDAGYNIVLNPLIKVTHHQGTSSQSNTKVGYYKKQSLVRYFRKHHCFISYRLVQLISRLL